MSTRRCFVFYHESTWPGLSIFTAYGTRYYHHLRGTEPESKSLKCLIMPEVKFLLLDGNAIGRNALCRYMGSSKEGLTIAYFWRDNLQKVSL